MLRATSDETIAAISTPSGEGGIGIVRLSGAHSLSIVVDCFHSSSGRDIGSSNGPVFHGEIRDGGEILDEVLVHVMRAPRSYTREDVVEINCHGGGVPLNAVLELVLKKGARLAGPGEFTKRAFLNGRIDLIQAEAVIDRIRAQTRASLHAASAAARGTLSRSLGEIRASLIEVKAHIEAAIDFPDQDVPELITPDLRATVEDVHARMSKLLDTADAGKLYREGASIAITGRPNVGKSSLFNALLREARAIVTSHPGTTRDVLEEVASIAGIAVKFFDMAGLHETDHEVEQIGVERARDTLQHSALILFVVDSSETVHEDDIQLAREVQALDVPTILVLNKIDLECAMETASLEMDFTQTVPISAKTGEGLEHLEEALANILLSSSSLAPDHGFLTRVHQKNSLRKGLDALQRLLDDFSASPEFLSIELEDALNAVGEVTGESTPDEILEVIFSEFCIGK